MICQPKFAYGHGLSLDSVTHPLGREGPGMGTRLYGREITRLEEHDCPGYWLPHVHDRPNRFTPFGTFAKT